MSRGLGFYQFGSIRYPPGILSLLTGIERDVRQSVLFNSFKNAFGAEERARRQIRRNNIVSCTFVIFEHGRWRRFGRTTVISQADIVCPIRAYTAETHVDVPARVKIHLATLMTHLAIQPEIPWRIVQRQAVLNGLHEFHPAGDFDADTAFAHRIYKASRRDKTGIIPASDQVRPDTGAVV